MVSVKSELREALSSQIYLRWFVILLILLPVIIEAIYIKIFGVNIVYWDQWDFVPFIEELYNNNLSFYDLFGQHNEHRLFFPRIIMLLLAYISRYNNIYEMYFSWMLVLLILVVVFLLYKSSFGSSTKMLMVFVPVSFIIFNLRQFENILWGFQLQIYLCVLGFVFSIHMLEKLDKSNLNLLLAIFGGILASYSFANGLVTWPVGLFFILISSKGRNTAVFWSLAGILAMGLYFYNWTKPPQNPSIFFIINQPIDGILYLLANIGSPLAYEKLAAISMGIFLLIIIFIEFVFLYKYNLLRANSTWLSFILFSLISSFVTTVGRAGCGLEQALSSRYVTFTLLGVIGVYLLAINLYNIKSQNRMHPILFGIVVSILVIGLMAGNMSGIEQGKSIRESRSDDVYYLKTYKLQADNNLGGLYPKGLYPIPKIVRDRAPFLEKYKLSIFADNDINLDGLFESQASTQYHIDTINTNLLNNMTVTINKKDTESITVTGWAVDGQANTLAKAVFISIDDKLIIPTRYYLDRVDVARFYKNGNFRYSGFMGAFNTSNLANGSHILTLKVISKEGNQYYKLNPEIKIVVAG